MGRAWILAGGSTLLLAFLMYGRVRTPRVLVFRNRAAAPVGFLKRLKDPPPALPEEVKDRHKTVAERVLLIRHPRVLNDKDFESDPNFASATSSWSFSKVMHMAFAGLSPDEVRTQLVDWCTGQKLFAVTRLLKDWQDRDKGLSLQKIPMRLLAIINRLDLARLGGDCPSGKLCGAEVRFVYAAIADSAEDHFLSLIVEFVLPVTPKKEFSQMARAWADLEGAWDRTDRTYFTNLESILSAGTGSAGKVRLRLNARLDATWEVRQFSFQQKGLKPQALDRQLHKNVNPATCQTASSELGGFILNNEHKKAILDSRYSLSQNLATSDAVIPGHQRVLTLAADIASDEDREGVRHSLSVNTCVGCHGDETGTSFHHIGYRVRDGLSPLSNFLRGKSVTGDPSLDYWPVSPPTVSGCGSKVADRQYNDLLRRHLYLYTVRQLNPDASDEDWIQALDRYKLPGMQVH